MDLSFKRFEIQLLRNSIGLRFKFNWFEIQLPWGSSDLRFKRFGCQSVGASSDLAVKCFLTSSWSTDLSPRWFKHDRGQVASPLGAMNSLVTLAGLSGLPLGMARSLEEEGWNVQRLGTLDDNDEDMVSVVLTSLEAKAGCSLDPEPLLALIETAGKAVEVSWNMEGRSSDAELAVVPHQKNLQDKLNWWRNRVVEKLSADAPKKGTAKVVRWPTKLQRKLNEVGDDARLRDRAKKEERSRWIKVLKEQLIDGECPALRDEEFCRDLSRRFGAGRRASTLHKHVKTWSKLSNWMLSTCKHPWPKLAHEFCVYLECLADEPCGRTVPSSVFKTLMFMENAGETAPEDQLCGSPQECARRGQHAALGQRWRLHEKSVAYPHQDSDGDGGSGHGWKSAGLCPLLLMAQASQAVGRDEVFRHEGVGGTNHGTPLLRSDSGPDKNQAGEEGHPPDRGSGRGWTRPVGCASSIGWRWGLTFARGWGGRPISLTGTSVCHAPQED